MRVIFNSTAEWLEEARRAMDAGEVEGGIARVTFEMRQRPSFPVLSVYLVAGYLVAGELVELEDFIGEQPTFDQEAVKIPNKGSELRKRVISHLETWGFKVRSGKYVP
jgi:hypothetical protein